MCPILSVMTPHDVARSEGCSSCDGMRMLARCAALTECPRPAHNRQRPFRCLTDPFYHVLVKAQHLSLLKDVVCAGNIHWFQALYYLASFFAQYGPNCTTWLIAGELIPTDTRAMAHGWAAAVGEEVSLFWPKSCLAHLADEPCCRMPFTVLRFLRADAPA